ncbi:MAG: glycosyltransferase family 2 protein [Gemmatimonadetes bacterium]|nr:glycosyltransferase family 2 protein [Gemmatimonadota bacterium]
MRQDVIYICIPAHNEERTIGVLLWKIRNVMGDFGRDYELLVFDDSSTDRTADVLARYEPVLPLTVVRGSARVGYEGAVEALVREAVNRASYPKRDVVVVLQGDFTESPDDLVSLVKVIEGGADVAASAAQRNGRRPRGVRLLRWALPVLLQQLYRAAPVSDPVSGFRAYRAIVLRKALEKAGNRLLHGVGWAANVELLYAVAPHARRIEEVPVKLRYDIRVRQSRFRLLATARHLVALMRHSRSGQPEQTRE